MIVSIAVKNKICSIVLTNGSDIVDKSLVEYKDWDTNNDPYKRMIYAVSYALRKYRNILESLRSDDIVTFEVSNSTFIKWVNREYSRVEYNEEFVEMLRELNKIPMRYVFVHSKKTKASNFLNEGILEKEELSGIDSLLDENVVEEAD